MQGRAMGVCGQRGLYPRDQSLLEHGLSPLLVGKELHLVATRRSPPAAPSWISPRAARRLTSSHFSLCPHSKTFNTLSALSHLPVFNVHFLSLYHHPFVLLRTFRSTTCISSPCTTPLCFFSPSGLQQAFPLHVSRLRSPSHLLVFSIHFLPLYHPLFSFAPSCLQHAFPPPVSPLAYHLSSFSAIKTYLLWRLYLGTILRRNPSLVPPLPTLVPPDNLWPLCSIIVLIPFYFQEIPLHVQLIWCGWISVSLGQLCAEWVSKMNQVE